MRHHTAWLWLGGTSATFATAFVGYAAALAATRTGYALWASGQMIAAYALAAGAGICLLAAVRDVHFPWVTVSTGKSWEVETTAAGGRWGCRIQRHRGRFGVMLECYQRGARVEGLRCILELPSGVRAVATNAVAETFESEHFNFVTWDYPDDFKVLGRGRLPDAVSGRYRATWLAQVAGQSGAVQLCDVTWDVPDEGQAQLVEYRR